ncbi:MAG: MFS transporter [Parafilimonas terrae]|jgi:MFS family permease|nr:MFS transporter [Parafilimonas terrae]
MTTTTPRVRRIQRLALTMLVLSGAVNTIDRAALAIANPLIRADLGLSLAQMGLLLSAFLWAYAFSQLPVGVLIDRFGPRRLLAAGIAVWSGAQLLCGLVTGTTQFFIARVLLGIGEAPQFPTGARVVRDWFNVRARGAATGVFNSASTLGTGLAAPLLTGLMLAFGWRWMFAIMGLLGLAVALLWFALYRDPAQVDLTEAENRHRTEGDPPDRGRRITLAEWGGLFRHASTWGMLGGFFGVIYQNWLFNAWMPGYLEIERHMSIAHTGLAAAVPYVFAVAGGLSGGVIADRLLARGWSAIGSRKLPLCLGMMGAASFIVLAALVPSNLVAVACLSAVMFCGTVATTNAWALVSVVAPAHCTASLGSLQNFGGYLGGALAPVATGLIVERTGSFVPALMVGAAMSVLASLVYLVLLRGPITDGPPTPAALPDTGRAPDGSRVPTPIGHRPGPAASGPAQRRRTFQG